LARLAAVGFCLGVLLRLPCAWMRPLLPQGLRCAQLQGTLWQGYCGRATWQGAPLGNVQFGLHPLALLRLRLAADIDLTGPGGEVRGGLVLGPGHTLRASNVHAVLPLSKALVSALPGGVHGQLQADLERLELRSGRVGALVGRIDVLHLETDGEPLGDYRLSFAPTAGTPTGELHDLGGPLDVQAMLRLSPSGYVLEGRVAARPQAAPDLARQISFLGSPDAAGRRPFSIAGTF